MEKNLQKYLNEIWYNIFEYKMNHPNENIAENLNDLKLLSINEARKILGLRHETLTKLIDKKKIGHLVIEDKIKIPFWCLKEFQEEQIKLTVNQNNGEVKDHLTLNNIQEEIDFIINQNN